MEENASQEIPCSKSKIEVLLMSDEGKDIRTSLAIIRTIDAEKRTHLAELRTGIGILTIPLSLLTILIATSDYYTINMVLPFIVATVIGIIALSIIGTYLVVQALMKIRNTEKLRANCKDVSCLLEEYQNGENSLSI